MVATPTLVSGAVKEGFERVRDAFEQNFTAHDEVGAAVCVYVDGRMVVDLWGGTADADAGRPWQRDTLMLIRSTTKGAAAICAAMLAERGELDVEAPVVDTWPEFGAQGKEEVPVAWVLCHRVGLPALDAWIGRDEAVAWDPVVEALAAQRPVWQPGTRHGYHALTYGFLVGEIVRRVTGRTLGRYFHDEVAQPLGLDFWIGLPNDAVARVAHMVPPAMPSGFDPATLPKQERNFIAAARDPATLTSRALSMTRPALDDNDPVVWSAELPAHNGIATAFARSPGCTQRRSARSTARGCSTPRR